MTHAGRFPEKSGCRIFGEKILNSTCGFVRKQQRDFVSDFEAMDQVVAYVKPLRDFAKDSMRLVKRCTKPDIKGC